MSTAVIQKRLEINASPEQVWRVFTDPAISRQIGGEYATDWEVGSSLGWKGLDGTLYTHGTITQIEPEELFQYQQFSLDDARHLLATITYQLELHGDTTILYATEELHSELTEKELEDASEGWNIALNAVKQTAENL